MRAWRGRDSIAARRASTCASDRSRPPRRRRSAGHRSDIRGPRRRLSGSRGSGARSRGCPTARRRGPRALSPCEAPARTTGPWHHGPQVSRRSLASGLARAARSGSGTRRDRRASGSRRAPRGNPRSCRRCRRSRRPRAPPPGRPAGLPSADPFLVGHVLQRVGEIGLEEAVAELRRPPPAGRSRRSRATTIVVVVLGDHGRHVLEDGEAVPGIADRRGGDLAEGHRALVAQRGDPGIRRRRHHGLEDDRAGIWPSCSRMNTFAGMPAGQWPRPAMVTTLPGSPCGS